MEKKKILFIAPYPVHKAPSQRLKYEQYYTHFEEAGYKIDTSSFIDEQFWEIIYKPGNKSKKFLYTLKGYARRVKDLFRARKYDIVYVHLWVCPFGPPIFEWLMRKCAKKLIYDIDDLIFLKETSKNNNFTKIFKSKNNSISLMKHADHVITCTPFLDEFVRKYNQKTSDISSTIDTNSYLPLTIKPIKKKLTIGWSGSHSTSKYMKLLESMLNKLHETIDFKLLIIGDENFKTNCTFEIEAIPWNEKTEVIDLQQIDIGLYPLPDEQWVYGKSGLKALQYMALEIPTIATAIGANFRVIEHEISGFLVNSDQEWFDSLKKLLESPELRMQIGENARKRVVNYYSIESTKNTYLNILTEVLKS